jgi:hypothetical protein
MDLFNTTYMLTPTQIEILTPTNYLFAANNLKKPDKLLDTNTLKIIFKALIAILFIISACILISFLWFKRRQMLIKEKNSIRSSTSNISELFSKI